MRTSPCTSPTVAYPLFGRSTQCFQRGARSVEKNALLAGLLVSGLLCLLGSLIHAQLPVWLKGDAEITSDAGRYFLSFSWMLPFTQLCSLTSSFCSVRAIC